MPQSDVISLMVMRSMGLLSSSLVKDAWMAFCVNCDIRTSAGVNFSRSRRIVPCHYTMILEKKQDFLSINQHKRDR